MADMVQEQMRRELEAAEAEVEFTPVIEVDEDTQHILKEYNVADAAISLLKAKYSGLKVAGVEDKKGYDMVHSARMEIRGYRTDVDKKRKALKEYHLEYGRKVDKEAKRITAALEEIEGPLDAEEKRIDALKEEAKQAAQREKDAKLQRRIDALTAVGAPVTVGDLVTMPDTTFAMVLQTATEAWQVKEAQRKAAEEALEKQRKAEAEAAAHAAEEKAQAEAAERARLAQVKAEQEAEAKKLEETRAALRKEQAEFEAKKAAQEQAAREEQIRKEAEAKAKADAERRAEDERIRKAAEALAAEKLEAEAAQRKKDREAARPDAEKLLALAQTFTETAYPVMVTDAGRKVMTEVEGLVGKLVAFTQARANAIADTKVLP